MPQKQKYLGLHCLPKYIENVDNDPKIKQTKKKNLREDGGIIFSFAEQSRVERASADIKVVKIGWRCNKKSMTRTSVRPSY